MKNFADKEKQQKTQEDKLEHQRKSSSELEEDSEEEISPPEFQLNEHIDCCDSVNKWLDAEIIAIRNNEIRVHFTGWSSKYDEWIQKDSNRVLKQWAKGNEFNLNNRLDVKDEQGKWLEARVIEINPSEIKVHFYNYSNKFDVWLDKNSERIAEVGKFSKAFGQIKSKIRPISSKTQEEGSCNSEHSSSIRPNQYAQELYKHGFIIRPVGEDGNCLFRSVSDQIYGTEKYYSEIRAFCMKYIEIEGEYFRNFIEGGSNIDNFYLYLECKKKDGVWGDDIEIQALSEIYNRPIEIYVYSSKPIRTFHETAFDGNEAIRLSYHGKSHYNSIKKREGPFSIKLAKEKFGEIEENAIKTAKNRQEKIKNSFGEIDKCLALSRNEFEIRNIRELEQALEESLMLNQKALEMKEIEDKMLNFSVKEYETEDTEKILLEHALKQSLEAQEKSLNNKKDIEMTPAVLKVVQEGFPLELVLQVYQLVGDDPALMIQMLTENMFS